MYSISTMCIWSGSWFYLCITCILTCIPYFCVVKEPLCGRGRFWSRWWSAPACLWSCPVTPRLARQDLKPTGWPAVRVSHLSHITVKASKKGSILTIWEPNKPSSIIFKCVFCELTTFLSGSYARPFNWPIQTAFPTMQPVRQDRRVSMGVNGDLYFSNVLINDSAADFCCNARFPYKNVIQQKMPVVVKVLTSECFSVSGVYTTCGSEESKYTFTFTLTRLTNRFCSLPLISNQTHTLISTSIVLFPLIYQQTGAFVLFQTLKRLTSFSS